MAAARAARQQAPSVSMPELLREALHSPRELLGMLAALLVNLAAFTALYALLVASRLELARLQDEAERLLAEGEPPLAGAAVTPPRPEGMRERG